MEKREILLVATVFAVLTIATPRGYGQDQGAPYELIGPFNSYVTVYDNHNVEPMRPEIYGRHGVVSTGNYAATLAGLRHRLGLSQQQLADKLSAAGKAVIYQWESGSRKPSPVFWLRIERLRRQQAVHAWFL